MNYFKFSLLIPCYGNAKYLKKTIESILSQTYSNFEIIICEQDTTSIVDLGLIDSRIKIIHFDTPSPYLSRIELYKSATGDYVWFVDDDDEIACDSLKLLNEILQQKQVDCVVFEKIDILRDDANSFRVDTLFSEQKIHSYSSKDAMADLLSTNNYNSVCCKLFNRLLCPDWIITNAYQSEDKLLNYSLYKVSKSFLKIDYALYKYYLYHGYQKKPLSLDKLNDSLKIRKILYTKEPDFIIPLLSSSLDHIIAYYLKNHKKTENNVIDFDFTNSIVQNIIKDLPIKKRVTIKLIIKRKFKYIRIIDKLISFLKIIKKAKSKLIDSFKNFGKPYLFLLHSLCFLLILPISFVSFYPKVQDVSNCITAEAVNQGFRLITFEKKDSSSGTRPDFSSEYYNLKDQFHSYSYCLETYDPLKRMEFRVTSISEWYDHGYVDLEPESLRKISFLTSPGIQIQEYDDNGSIAYKNNFYEFNLKYRGLGKNESHYPIFCAIHQKQSDELLTIFNSISKSKISEEDLIGKYIKVCSINMQESFIFRLCNVIKEKTGFINDYSDALGNFILVNNYTFGKKELNNSYLMSKNNYENYFNIKTRMSIYRDLNYKILYGSEISSSNAAIEIKLNSILNDFKDSTAVVVSLSLIDYVLFFSSLIVFYRLRKKYSFATIAVGMLLPAFPYILFKVLSTLFNSCILYSYITSVIYFIFALTYEGFMVFLLLKLVYEKKR